MIRLNISKRLLEIAKMVDLKSTVVDVGCDHALLDIYLTKNKLSEKVIATDITLGAVKGALKNVELYNALNVDVRLGDGLSTIKNEDKITTIIMSGLGNQKIIKILKDNKEKLTNVDTIIIQSNTGYFYVRKELNKLGYYVIDESLVKDRKIIYVIIKFKKGNIKHSRKQLYFGPILLKNKDNLFFELINNEINKNKKIIKKLPPNKIFKKLKLRLMNNRLKKEILI